jgi:hypothetical protein
MSNAVNKPTEFVNLYDLARAIPLIGPTLTPLVEGEPGTAKSTLLKIMEEHLGDAYHYVYFDCPVMDPSDLGLRIPDRETGRLEYYPTGLVPLDGKPVIIMLDELAKATKMMKTMFTRLMLEKYLGDVKLPEGSIVFATSNNASDGVGDTMELHSINRIMRVKLKKVTSEEWCVWASQSGVHPVIRAWADRNPKAFQSYREITQKELEENTYGIFDPRRTGQPFLSPRSLAKCDPIVRNKSVLGMDVVRTMLSGTIGPQGAESLAMFISIGDEVTRTADVIADPMGTPIPTKIAALIMMMFYAVDDIKTQDDLSKFMQFVGRVPSREVSAVFYTMMCKVPKNVRLVRGNATLTDWAAKNYILLS